MKLHILNTLLDTDRGYEVWSLNKLNHRKFWYKYKNEELHREDGPAATYADGWQEWYLNGAFYLEKDYLKEMIRRSILVP